MKLIADLSERTITGLALPFGSEGRTSLGKVTASRGTVSVPEDVSSITLNKEHEYRAPVGRCTSLEETEEGLVATFRVAETSAGDDLLVEVSEGLRTGLSVEIDNPVIKAGRLLGGMLSAVAACVRPAFDDARILTASDTEVLVENPLPVTEPETEEKESAVTDSTLTAAAVPSTVNVHTSSAPLTFTDVTKALANRDQKVLSAAFSGEDSTLFAAAGDVTSTGHTNTVTPIQWLGELWNGKAYNRRIVPLLSSGTLTSWRVQGFKVTQGPTVSPYAGDLTAITSTDTVTEPVQASAERLAGGWPVDRKFVDFNDVEFLNALYRTATEDYARKTDVAARNAIVASATDVTAGAVPTGVNPGIARIVDGALAMIDVAQPTFALVSPDVYRSILLTREDDSLKYLSSALGLEEGSVDHFALVPDSGLAAGTVIVGAKEAATFYELPGSPIRAEALDISHGGVDNALFGYFATLVNDERAIVNVEV